MLHYHNLWMKAFYFSYSLEDVLLANEKDLWFSQPAVPD